MKHKYAEIQNCTSTLYSIAMTLHASVVLLCSKVMPPFVPQKATFNLSNQYLDATAQMVSLES